MSKPDFYEDNSDMGRKLAALYQADPKDTEDYRIALFDLLYAIYRRIIAIEDMSKVELIKGTTYELKEGSKYIIVFDRHDITPADAYQLLKQLERLQIKGVGVMLNKGNTLELIEYKEKK